MSALADTASQGGDQTGTPSPEAVALAQAKATGAVVEVVADRQDDSTTYAHPDGQLSTRFTEGPTRAETDDGLKPIDQTLVTKDSDLAPSVSPVDVVVSGDGTGALGTLTTDSGSVGLGWIGDLATPDVQGASATYADSANVAVQVAATNDGFSQNVVLSSAPTSAPSYVMPLHLNGLTPSLSNGVLTLTAADGSVAAATNPLRMWDSQIDADGTPLHSAAVSASLQATGDDWSLVLSPSMSFLTDPATVYPVTVDPTVIESFADSRTDISYASDGSTGNFAATRMTIGRIAANGSYDSSSTPNTRTWLSFKIGRFVGRDIASAQLDLYQIAAGDCSNRPMHVYPATANQASPFTYAHNTGNVITDSEWKVDASFNYGSSPAGRCSTNTTAPVDVTKIVAGWASGELQQRKGFWLAADDETSGVGGKVFCSFHPETSGNDCAATPGNDRVPQLDVYWTSELGAQSYFSTTAHRLNDRSQLIINNENGNAVIKADDVKVSGRGLDLDLSRYYNGADTDDEPSFGTGWVMSAGGDVRLTSIAGYGADSRFDYRGPGGTHFGEFVRKTTGGSSNAFYSPTFEGLDADLQDDNNKNTSTHTHTFTMTFHSSQLQYVFDDFGVDGNPALLTKEIDRSGNQIVFGYDVSSPTSPRWTSATDTHARTFNICYNTNGKISSIRESDACSVSSPTGRTWSYDYTSSGFLHTYTDPMLAVTTYNYTGGQVTSIVDPAQQNAVQATTTLGYSSAQLTSVEYATGGAKPVRFTYEYSSVRDMGSNTAADACNKSGDSPVASYSTKVTDVNDDNVSGHPTYYCFTDRNDDDTSNSGDRFVRVIDGLGNRRSTRYNPNQKPTTATSASGDGVGSASSVATYASNGLLGGVTDPTDDATNDVAAQQYTNYDLTDSSIKGYQYLPSSNTDSMDICTAYEYDTTGRMISAYSGRAAGSNHGCLPGGAREVHSTYNPDGTLLMSWNSSGSISSPSDDTVYSYYTSEPKKGQLRRIVRAGGNSTCSTDRTLCTDFDWDSDSRLYQTTDGNGALTTYSYDKDDRVTQVLYNGTTTCTASDILAGTCVKYTWDAEGNLVQRDDGTDVSGGSGNPPTGTVFTYDSLNRLSSETLPSGTVLAMKYDGANDMTEYKQTLPQKAADTTTYTYDAANELTGVTDVQGTFSASYTMSNTADGQLHVLTLPTSPTVTVTYDYTKSNRMKTITPSGATGLNAISYTYTDVNEDSNHKHHERRKVLSMTTNSVATTYTYGTASGGRLTEASVASGPDYTYSYDYDGNLQSTGNGTSTTYYGYTEDGHLCYGGSNAGTEKARACPTTPSGDTAYTSDAAGNNKGTAAGPNSYNGADQAITLTAPSGTGGTMTETYADQGNDLRVQSVSVSGDKYGSVNGPLGITARQYTPSGAGTQTTYYTRDNEGNLLGQHGGDGTGYYYTDRQNSTIALVKPDGTVGRSFSYDPMGKTTAGTNNGATTPFRWKGGYQDEVDGFYHFGARYYDSASHFMQPDPEEGSISKPASLNRFSYADGDPVNRSDASGRFSFGDIVDDAKTFFGDVGTFAGGGAGIGAVIGCGIGEIAGEEGCTAVGETGAVIGGIVGGVVGVGVGIYDLITS